ncbi:MAG: hypothetical protein K8J08_10920 [Thermoanaerobaculia bacterium]|nr:hypothetical protein [Thermoanaerobaculia bacterium]
MKLRESSRDAIPLVRRGVALGVLISVLGLIGTALPVAARAARLVRDIDLTRSPHLPPSCPLSPCPIPEPFFGSVLSRLTPFGDGVVFSADDGVSGLEPWISDGSEAGTYRLGDLIPGGGGSSPIPLGTASTQTLLWAFSGVPSSWQLWSASGDPASVVSIPLPCDPFCAPSSFDPYPRISVGSHLFFWIDDLSTQHTVLYRSDGSPLGTEPVHDLCLGAPECTRSPREMVPWHEGVVYSEGPTPSNASLWAVDSPTGAATPLFSPCRGTTALTPWNDELYFGASCFDDPSGLYATDGTALPRRIHDLAGGTPVASVTTSSGVFLAVRTGPSYSSARTLWYTDGTTTGTRSVGQTDFVAALNAVNESLLVAAQAPGDPRVLLWRIDPDGTRTALSSNQVRTEIAVHDDIAYFAATDLSHGTELWRSNGTPDGTVLLADIYPGPRSSNPTDGGVGRSGFAIAGGDLFFAADHPDYDIELWATPLDAEPEPNLCEADNATLCLQGQFRLTVDWTDHEGGMGTGTAVPLANDTGAFWFFDEGNLELMVKVIDACDPPWNNYWVFAGGLTDVELVLTVEDLATQTVRRYPNTGGTPFLPVQDTMAFDSCPSP